LVNSRDKVLIVSHDSGGAEILSAWVKKNKRHAFFYCLSGPAESIFNRKLNLAKEDLIKEEQVPNLVSNMVIDWILTGTSVQNKLELRIIKAIKRKAVKTVTFLDHWINHRERFGHPDENWIANLPDEVWCGDEHCYSICQELGFPKNSLRLVENPYFDEIVKNAAIVHTDYKEGSILYLAEPVAEPMQRLNNDAWHLGYTEWSALDHFFQKYCKICPSPTMVTIRLHPSEEPSKYHEYLNSLREGLNIRISSDTTLIEDIKAHQYIIGTETMAMVVALLLKKTVYTAIPPGGKKCELPFKEIRTLL